MSTWRSEPMRCGTLVIPSQGAKTFVEMLGRKCNISFCDMNEHNLVRPYRRSIQRLAEMERVLRVLTSEITRLPGIQYERKNFHRFLNDTGVGYKLDAVEAELKKAYETFVQFRINNRSILDDKISTLEHHAVAMVAATAIDMRGGFDSRTEGLGFSVISGVIVQDELERFSRTVYRTTRGNAYVHFEPLSDDQQAAEIEMVPKSVFVVFFQGGSESIVYQKVSRQISAFNATEYPWPVSRDEAREVTKSLTTTINDWSRTLQAYEDHFIREVAALLDPVRPGANSLIGDWELFCCKEKSLYAILDRFEDRGGTLRCTVWYPLDQEAQIKGQLSAFHSQEGPGAFLLADEISKETPPTYFRNNGFTLGFQNFVDAYGVPRYGEANPAVLTSVTLPFLFGVMYGDIGHGSFILAVGILLVLFQERFRQNDNELVQMMYGGRYMILMMGCFSVYSGFLYNDFFSLGLDLFGTRYEFGEAMRGSKAKWIPKEGISFPYPFGFDPVWKGAENELLFANSFKMKFSVIVAGLQMSAGIGLKGLNAFWRRDYFSFLFEFLPQIAFFWSFVGYMDFMIFYKWITPGDQPNLITATIELAMLKAPTIFLFPRQNIVQLFLAFVMVVSVPLMLFPKPILLNQKHSRSRELLAMAQGPDSLEGVPDDSEHVKFDFAEEFINQVIETMEFVLGSISNTASYLRLWALSLAHQQLSVVFFDQTILRVLNLTTMGFVAQTAALFVAFSVFASATAAIMLAMDSLECYLHALRLQWVEFQSKFYKGDGEAFQPFIIHQILERCGQEE